MQKKYDELAAENDKDRGSQQLDSTNERKNKCTRCKLLKREIRRLQLELKSARRQLARKVRSTP